MIGVIWTPEDEICFSEAKKELEFIRLGYIKQGYKIIRVTPKEFECENGDLWKIIIANYDSPRGQRYNISYIHRRISGDFIEKVIEPATLTLPYCGHNYYGTPLSYYYLEDKEEDKADNELDNLRCPLCGNKFVVYLDEFGHTPWHIHCKGQCDINIGCAHMKDGVNLLKNFLGVPNLHIEHYRDKIQSLSIDGIWIINNENN